MSKTIMAEVGGFTPVIDDLVSEFDVTTALVFGKVWRYCQMHNGECYASIGTMSEELGVGRNTFIRRLEKLVKYGYLDKKQNELGGTNIYSDTGKAGMQISITAGINDRGITHSGLGLTQGGLGDNPQRVIKKQVKKETKIESLSPKEPAIPPATIQTPKPSKTASDPRSKHPAIQAVRELVQRYPKQALYDEIISDLGDHPDIEKLKGCRVEWLARGYNANSIKWCEWYKAGGVPARNGNGTSRPGSGNPVYQRSDPEKVKACREEIMKNRRELEAQNAK